MIITPSSRVVSVGYVQHGYPDSISLYACQLSFDASVNISFTLNQKFVSFLGRDLFLLTKEKTYLHGFYRDYISAI